MNEEEENEEFLNVMRMLKPLKIGLEDADKEILKTILTELQKVNNTLEQILNYCRNKQSDSSTC